MKYLLGFLEGLSDGPNLADPGFQQLLIDVQAGKPHAKPADTFYESLEKVINELKSSPESLPFQRPVAKRDAPDYFDIIKNPMDLGTMTKNIKAHKYKTKAEFASDLNLIWENCFLYNHEMHPIRVQARFMKQKADHHLEFLLDRSEIGANPILPLLPQATGPLTSGGLLGESSSTRQSLSASRPTIEPSPSRAAPATTAETSTAGAVVEEDAAGESDEEGAAAAKGTEGQDGSQSFRQEAGAGPSEHTAAEIQTQETSQGIRQEAPAQAAGSGVGGEASQTQKTGNVDASGRPSEQADESANRVRRSSPPYKPKLQTSLESTPAIIRTQQTMNQFYPLSLANQSGPSNLDKGKAKEILQNIPPPAWYPTRPSGSSPSAQPFSLSPVARLNKANGVSTDDEDDTKYLGNWWGSLNRDEAYAGGMPSVPNMVPMTAPKRRRIGHRKQLSQVLQNGESSSTRILATDPTSPPTPTLKASKPVNLESAIHRNVDKLIEAKRVVGEIQDFQRIEMEGGILPHIKSKWEEREQREVEKKERVERNRKRRIEREAAHSRWKVGGEVGEKEAVLEMKKATAGMLAHAGFDGANEIALNTFTRLSIEYLRNVGRTFRLFQDGLSHHHTPEQMILHVLHENGQTRLSELEGHIKDDIEREGGKIAEMSRKVKQAYKDVTTAPVIEDDMLFAEDGEMLMDGNFADELGEDFLGLREMGIDREFGLSSLTVPSALFHGRRKRNAHSGAYGGKGDRPDYSPPPPFIPLLPSAISTQVPALLHSFYQSRLESGLGLLEDDPFDHVHSQIGSMGQIVVKNPPAPIKKKRDEEQKDEVKKVKVKKAAQPGVGKGNWIRPPKSERDRRAAEKKAALERAKQTANGGMTNGSSAPMSDGIMGAEDDAMGEEDADGEVL